MRPCACGGREELRALIFPRSALFFLFDYDGTLVPLARTPQEAVPPPGLLETLRALLSLPGVEAAVVSGRGMDDLLSLLPVRGLYLVGLHGLVFSFPEGGVKVKEGIGEETRGAVARLAAAAAPFFPATAGFLMEDKGYTLALHYRLASPLRAAAAFRRAWPHLRPLLRACRFSVFVGKKVWEFRPAGTNKGEAVLFLLSRHPGYYPVYFGDDLTDEDAFRALAGRGCGVLVGPPRRTAARFRLGSPEEVLGFLRDFVAARARAGVKIEPGGG